MSANISGKTHLVCLLGKPTAHSLSPALHNRSFQLLGIDAVYTCFDVDPADLGGIVAAFKAMERWDGFNLTMPCKQAVIAYLDKLDAAAQLIGAVNVVKKVDGRAVGFNTDGVGFMASLAQHGVKASGLRMVLLGPGGAGSAIMAQAALDGVAVLDVFARVGGASYCAAQDVAARVGAATGCQVQFRDMADRDALASCIQAADVLVNATSVGMGEDDGATLVPKELIKPGMVVADAIYHPRCTRLIREADELGCVTVPGLGMLLEQAAEGERIWYGVRMPVQQIKEELFG